jgi:hypothetical protein
MGMLRAGAHLDGEQEQPKQRQGTEQRDHPGGFAMRRAWRDHDVSSLPGRPRSTRRDAHGVLVDRPINQLVRFQFAMFQ